MANFALSVLLQAKDLMSSAMRQAQQSIRNLETQSKTSGANTENSMQKVENSAQEMEKGIRSSTNNSAKEIEKVENAAEKMEKETKNSTQQTSKNFDNLEKNIKSSINKSKSYFDSFKNGMNEAADYAKKTITTIAGSGIGITLLGAQTERAMTNASTMFTGSFQPVEKYIDYFSTKYGQLLSKMNNLAYSMGSASISVKDSYDVMNTTGMAAVAGQNDIVQTFETGIGIINAFGMSVKNLGGVYELLATGTKYGQLNSEQLTGNLGQIIPVARSLNETLSDTVLNYSLLTKYGLDANMAATAMAGAYRDLGAQAETLKDNDISVFDKSGNFLGLIKIIDQIRSKVKGLNDEEKNTYLNNLGFTEEANRAIKTIISNYDSFVSTMKEAKSSSGALAEMYAKQVNSLWFQIDRLMATADKLKMSVYNAMKSNNGVIIRQLIGWFSTLANWIDKNQEKFMQFIQAILRIAVVVVLINTVVGAVAKLADVFGFLMNPITWIVGGILLLFSSLKSFSNLGWAEILQGVLEGLGKFIQWFIQVLEAIKKDGFLKWLADGIRAILEWIGKQAFSIALNFVQGTLDIAKWILDGGKDITLKILGGFAAGYEWLKDIAPKVVEWTVKLLTGIGAWAYENIKTAYSWLSGLTITVFSWTVTLGMIGLEVVKDAYSWLSGLTGKTIEYIAKITSIDWSAVSKEIADSTLKVFEWTVNLAWGIIPELIRTGILSLWLMATWGVTEAWNWLKIGDKNLALNILPSIEQKLLDTWGWLLKKQKTIELILKPIFGGQPEVNQPKDTKDTKDTKGTKAANPYETIKVPSYGVTPEKSGTHTGKDNTSGYIEKGTKSIEDLQAMKAYGSLLMMALMSIMVPESAGALQGPLKSIIQSPAFKAAFGFASGGYTGNGGKFDVAGVVHAGEYVIPAWLVRQNPELIATLENKRRGFSEGGMTSFISATVGTSRGIFDDISKIFGIGSNILDVLKSTKPVDYSTEIDKINTKLEEIRQNTTKTADTLISYGQGESFSYSQNETFEQALEKYKNILISSKSLDENKIYQILSKTGMFEYKTAEYTNPESGEKSTLKYGFGLNQFFDGMKNIVFGPALVLIEKIASSDIIQNGMKAIQNWWKGDDKKTGFGEKLSNFWNGKDFEDSSGNKTHVNGVKDHMKNAGNFIAGAYDGLKNIPVLGTITSMIEPVIGGLGQMLGAALGPLGSVAMSILSMVAGLENVGKTFDFIGTIAKAAFDVIGPLINSAFQPFVNILEALGGVLGTLLVPLLEPVFASLQFFGEILTWLYNVIIVPISRALYVLFGSIASAFSFLYNVVSDIVSGLTLGAINIGKREVKSIEKLIQESNEKIQTIETKKTNVEKANQSNSYTASVTRSGPEVVNIYIENDNRNSNFYSSETEFNRKLIETVQKALDNCGLKVPKIAIS